MIGRYPLRHTYSSLQLGVLDKFTPKIFIETGSNVGHGIQVALRSSFKEIHSIEGVFDFFYYCFTRFSAESRVHMHYGDSAQVLQTILASLAEPAVIYLDAHSEAYNPLLEELAAIRDFSRFDNVILIDDVRMFDTPAWHGLRQRDALHLLREINAKYVISYEDTTHAAKDLLVALPV